jgi:hypothetical protein
MEIALLIFILPLFLMSISMEEKPDKTLEEKLGDALANYLKDGVNVKIKEGNK